MAEDVNFADAILQVMDSQGFHVEKSDGAPGREVVTLKNDAGEERTLRFGFTPVKPRNYRLNLENEVRGSDNK